MFDRIKEGMYWDKSLRLVEGCTKVSPGCKNCWSEAQCHIRKHQRNAKIRAQYPEDCTDDSGIWTGKVHFLEQNLDVPANTKNPTVFSIWNDLFHEGVSDISISVTMAMVEYHKEHIFLLLTKRPERMKRVMTTYKKVMGKVPANLWLGVTAENHAYAMERIPLLLGTPAAKRFISVEPMLGKIDLTNHEILKENVGIELKDWKTKPYKLKELRSNHIMNFLTGEVKDPAGKITARYPYLDWVICGGETGRKPRGLRIDWAYFLRSQCIMMKHNVPFYFKGWGNLLPWEIVLDGLKLNAQNGKVFQLKEYTKEEITRHLGKKWWIQDYMFQQLVNKKEAGRKLLGIEYNGIPKY